MKKLIAFCYRHPALVMILLLIGTLAALSQHHRVTAISSLESFFSPNHGAIVEYKGFKKRFGDAPFLAVVISGADMLQPQNLNLVRKVSVKAKAIDGVTQVMSLTDIELPRQENEAIAFRKLAADNEEISELTAQKIKADLPLHPALTGTLIAKDMKAATVFLMLKPGIDGDLHRKIVSGFGALVSELVHPPLKVSVAGDRHLESALSEVMMRDHIKFSIMIISVLIGTGWLCTRSLLLPGLAVLWAVMALILSSSILILLDQSHINMVNSLAVPISLLLASISNLLIVFSCRNMPPVGNRPPEEAIFPFMQAQFRYFLLIFLIPIFAQQPFTFSPINSMKELAIRVTLMLIINGLLAGVLLPIVLARFFEGRLKPRGTTPVDRFSSFISQHLSEIHPSFTRSKVLLAVVAVTLSAVSFYGLHRLNVSTPFDRFLRADHPLHQDLSFIDQHLSGIYSVEFSCSVTDPQSDFTDPAKIERLEVFVQRFITAMRGNVTRSYSLLDYLKEMHRVFATGTEKGHPLPQSAAEVRDHLEIIELANEQLLRSFISQDRKTVRLFFAGKMLDYERQTRINEFVNKHAADILGPGLALRQGGTFALQTELDNLLKNTLWIISATFVLLAIILLGRMGSIGIAWRTIGISFASASVTLVALGYLQIPLDVIGCIACSLIPVAAAWPAVSPLAAADSRQQMQHSLLVALLLPCGLCSMMISGSDSNRTFALISTAGSIAASIASFLFTHYKTATQHETAFRYHAAVEKKVKRIS
jgi:predicted RND superfamily exporter protein